MYWPFKKTIFISRCFWDYYLHVFQKDYAYALKECSDTEVIWIDRPTKHPLVWFKERKRKIDGITVLRPWGLVNEYEKFRTIDRKIFDLQISKYIGQNACLWSICCTHPWLSKKHTFSKTIYWPGDYFEPMDEFQQYKDYDLIMPWVGLKNIPSNFSGRKFLSSTCAGNEFMNFHANQLLDQRFDKLTKYKNKVAYIGGLSWERIDFELLSKMASTLENSVFLMGVKSDGLQKTEEAKLKLLQNHSNIRIWEDLNYNELAELVFKCDVGIIPYRVSGQNLRICPNKFFEYSALGKNTVTTSIPSMSRYSPPAFVAKSHQDFVDLLNISLRNPNNQELKDKLSEIAQNSAAPETLKRIGSLISQ